MNELMQELQDPVRVRIADFLKKALLFYEGETKVPEEEKQLALATLLVLFEREKKEGSFKAHDLITSAEEYFNTYFPNGD